MHVPLKWLIPLAMFTFVGGCIGGGCVGAMRTPFDRGDAVYARLPHHVPPSPDSASFRFAMVHDVIHERYARHGPAFYEERERISREKMAVLHPESEAALAFTDDIAVGLARRGRTDEAIAIMRDKLKRQQAIGLVAKDLYTSYANLGEFLVQGNVWAMMSGSETARARVREGRGFLKKAMDFNPKAHFGREEWNLVALDAFVRASESSAHLRECDLIGNRVDATISIPDGPFYPESAGDDHARFARPYSSSWVVAVYYENDAEISQREIQQDPTRATAFRRHIAQVGREEGPIPRGKRAPFDEPALWLIGEWRQGSGPNPHYALCLGEIMLRVGQRYLAWNCYERASRMAQQFWPTPQLQQFLRDHCKKRQKAIEESLPKNEVEGLRSKFEAELALGEKYQRDYQEFEETKIRAGGNINDEHFYDEFHTSRPPIASKVGPEEWYAGERSSGFKNKFAAFWSWGLLTGGVLVMLLAVMMRLLGRTSRTSGGLSEEPEA